MNNGALEFSEYFRLKPTRAAKVSEISEATAASSASPEDRVNFHIGNPVQDKRLSSAYLRAVLGLDIQDDTLTEDDPAALLQRLDRSESERPIIELFTNLIRKSAPYLPRGGFARSAPLELVVAFSTWLQQQQDPLTYDLGKTTNRREIILASGGIAEVLRIVFHALSGSLARLPARVMLFRTSLPSHVTSFEGLQFEMLADDERTACAQLRSILSGTPPIPTFVVVGAIIQEETRRTLRTMSLNHPLFFIEASDAPNHLSLGRESRLIDRVIRLLTPSVFSPRFSDLSLVFVAGNADYLSLFETIHFQLKGTPSSTEAELLTFLLSYRPTDGKGHSVAKPFPVEPPLEPPGFTPHAETTLVQHASRVESHVSSALQSHGQFLESALTALQLRTERVIRQTAGPTLLPVVDNFARVDAADLMHEFAEHVDQRSWLTELQQSFLNAFAHHHPEYETSSCVLVSGSSRTALSLLGFHCGLREVVIADLSWTYEHTFPSVHAVPLTARFDLDKDAMRLAVDQKLSADPKWSRYGAVVINNPHNATGRVFETSVVKELLQNLLQRGVTVIDDLSYQNLAPSQEIFEIPTLRQLADELVRTGQLSTEQSRRLITVHSLSKTDCFAGARLSVVEIRDPDRLGQFRTLNESIRPNIGAILLAYLFYRNSLEVTRAFWRLRNHVLYERTQALLAALENLPADRNPFAIEIQAPTGSMYPLMTMRELPGGLSLDWVASGLARQGIGMVPLSAFARTEKGFETARKTFRLTLGGSDGADTLLRKTRRVLIDLNRLIAEEGAQYQRRQFRIIRQLNMPEWKAAQWHAVEQEIHSILTEMCRKPRMTIPGLLRNDQNIRVLSGEFAPDRLAVYGRRFLDRSAVMQELADAAVSDNGKVLGNLLEQEFYKDNLQRRERAFLTRLFDRTVHPTQMYSLRTELTFDAIIQSLLAGQAPSRRLLSSAANEIVSEFLGRNVAVTSSEEADEIVMDLDAQIAAELFGDIQGQHLPRTFLSFWGDWDGSNRPSGQGHVLVASVLLANVRRLSHLLRLLTDVDRNARVGPDLLAEIGQLPTNTRRFLGLLGEITLLTHQLEKRYKGILPFHAKPGKVRQLGMALHVARDPVTSLWYHNDRLERRMLELRRKRREALEYYFALNKRLRKALHGLIPALLRNLNHEALLRETVLYRDLLQRFLITPRIHQNMVTAQDPFAIDTTVFNINEINEISARHGNPGMVLALQISMATRPEALIELDRKMRSRREHVLRDHSDIDLPSPWLIPLIEDAEAVRGMTGYLNKLWEYSLQSRRLNQETRDRFAEIIEEVFIAGSDLSQQVGQAAGAQVYRQAKHDLMRWLAEHGLVDRIRLKLGSGEPMQRQGGYYAEMAGRPAFLQSEESSLRFANHLRESTRRSTLYATTPMLGVFAGGDLRTFQSAFAERMRHLPVTDLAQLLYHVFEAQETHRRDLVRASEEFTGSRLSSASRGEQALERLTIGTYEKAFDDFLKVHTDNFRQILYGREEDVVGIYIISYFVARAMPPLRDRPTVRPAQRGGDQGNRILERIAETIPFSRYGSQLRAIAHNQAQTAVLGINQLTTGLFRALDTFSGVESVEGDAETFLMDHILPHLPVYEILQSLRLYYDTDQQVLRKIEHAFPAGNSAFLALREDIDAMAKNIPLFQQELLRRHGIDVSDFFEGARFIPDLLPTLRPDLVVLLQPDLFNCDLGVLQSLIGGKINRAWLDAVSRLLGAPQHIKQWRSHAWSLLERPVYERVQSFVELATSLYSISSRGQGGEFRPALREHRLSSRLDSFFRMSRADDEMRQFLAAAMEYLTITSEGMLEVPANIIRAMKEVERIAAIEEQALSPDEQDQLRFYVLQIARLAGENG